MNQLRPQEVKKQLFLSVPVTAYQLCMVSTPQNPGLKAHQTVPLWGKLDWMDGLISQHQGREHRLKKLELWSHFLNRIF